jgi:hypothetical protein
MRIMTTRVATANVETHEAAFAMAKTLLPNASDIKVIRAIEAPKTNPTITWHAWSDELAKRLVLAPTEWVETLANRLHASESHWHEATWIVKHAAHERTKRDRMIANWEAYWLQHNVAFSINAIH